ncbi:MAG TPA: glycosyltransferase family 4 protein [Chromobacteriaceae bacterium]|nr:glycosyltransferase family 4 protein [Chromobacteriaceae bacterium]
MTERPTRILIIGSASVHTWRYLAGIAPHVDELYLACNGDVPLERRPANLKDVLRVDFRLAALGTARRLQRWLAEIQPQLVHVHQANSVAWHAQRALAGSGIPLVLTAWGSDVLLLPERNRLMRQMVRANLKAADVITSDSLYMAARIRALAGESCQIRLLNYGIDALPAVPDLAAKPRNVLSCRLHKPLYRIDAILHGWAAVEADPRFADWTLTVAASGSETDALKRLAENLGLRRVDFTGFVSSDVLNQLYRQARVFVSVPRSDATSISLLEAMGHGCLPLLSNLPANGEWVIDGLNGIIAEDVAQLAPSLMRAMTLAEDNEQLARSVAINRELVAAKALHADNMAAFAALYRELLARQGKTGGVAARQEQG